MNNVQISNPISNSISQVFHLREARENIFNQKYKILYENINKIRKELINKNIFLCKDIEKILNEESINEESNDFLGEIIINPHAWTHEYALDRTSISNWRESAAVLGLYYLLDK